MTFSTDWQLVPAGGDAACRTVVKKTLSFCAEMSAVVVPQQQRENLDADEEQKEELQTKGVVNQYGKKNKSEEGGYCFLWF